MTHFLALKTISMITSLILRVHIHYWWINLTFINILSSSTTHNIACYQIQILQNDTLAIFSTVPTLISFLSLYPPVKVSVPISWTFNTDSICCDEFKKKKNSCSNDQPFHCQLYITKCIWNKEANRFYWLRNKR